MFQYLPYTLSRSLRLPSKALVTSCLKTHTRGNTRRCTHCCTRVSRASANLELCRVVVAQRQREHQTHRHTHFYVRTSFSRSRSPSPSYSRLCARVSGPRTRLSRFFPRAISRSGPPFYSQGYTYTRMCMPALLTPRASMYIHACVCMYLYTCRCCKVSAEKKERERQIGPDVVCVYILVDRDR